MDRQVNFKATKGSIVKRLNGLSNPNTKYDYSTVCDEILGLLLDCFGYASHQQGITGFQAGCIDSSFLFISRGIQKGRLQNFENLLYPQYLESFNGADSLIAENIDWLADEAQKKIKQDSKDRKKTYGAHPDVRQHWEYLVSLRPIIKEKRLRSILESKEDVE